MKPLDYSLKTSEERAQWLRDVDLSEATQTELTKAANYLLYDCPDVKIPTKNGTWDHRPNETSLEGLMESPSFNDARLRPLTAIPLRNIPASFSRETAKNHAPAYIKPTLETMWRRIDELELAVSYYDRAHGRRKTLPKEDLVAQFTPEERARIESEALRWTPIQCNNRRHEMVELRQNQFTVRDMYDPTSVFVMTPEIDDSDRLRLSSDVAVLPLGTKSATSPDIWRPIDQMLPHNYTEESLAQISQYIWRPNKLPLTFDFRNTDHLRELIDYYQEMRDGIDPEDIYDTTQAFLDTFDYYVELAHLPEIYLTILEYKKRHYSNYRIVEELPDSFSFSTNYVSTIFCQKVLPRIAEAASYHERVVTNLFFPEEFKRCVKCGRVFLRDPRNFARKARAKDGFAPRCKPCDRRP